MEKKVHISVVCLDSDVLVMGSLADVEGDEAQELGEGWDDIHMNFRNLNDLISATHGPTGPDPPCMDKGCLR